MSLWWAKSGNEYVAFNYLVFLHWLVAHSNRKPMPELSLTFLGSEFTCLVSAFRTPLKLACHLPYLFIANNLCSWGKNRDSQSLLKRQRTSRVHCLYFMLQVRNLMSREVKSLLQGAPLLGSGWMKPAFPLWLSGLSTALMCPVFQNHPTAAPLRSDW